MQILTIQKGIEAFAFKNEPFKRDSKHSNAILTIWMHILTIRKRFEAFKCKFQPFERHSKHSNVNLNHSKGSRSIRMQIQTLRTRFEVSKCKFERDSKQSNANSNHFKGIQSTQMQNLTIWTKFEAFVWNSNPSNEIWSIWTQTPTIQRAFEAFECKFEWFDRESKHSNSNSYHSNEIEAFQCKL